MFTVDGFTFTSSLSPSRSGIPETRIILFTNAFSDVELCVVICFFGPLLGVAVAAEGVRQAAEELTPTDNSTGKQSEELTLEEQAFLLGAVGEAP